MEKIDFYAYGMRKFYDNNVILAQTAKEIEEKYGKDARLDFECGVISASSLNVSKSMENNFRPSGSKIVTDDTEMNNSYINEPGVGPRL